MISSWCRARLETIWEFWVLCLCSKGEKWALCIWKKKWSSEKCQKIGLSFFFFSLVTRQESIEMLLKTCYWISFETLLLSNFPNIHFIWVWIAWGACPREWGRGLAQLSMFAFLKYKNTCNTRPSHVVADMYIVLTIYIVANKNQR